MPFKRKISTPDAPKRSTRKAGGGKRKFSPAEPAKAKKARTLHL